MSRGAYPTAYRIRRLAMALNSRGVYQCQKPSQQRFIIVVGDDSQWDGMTSDMIPRHWVHGWWFMIGFTVFTVYHIEDDKPLGIMRYKPL